MFDSLPYRNDAAIVLRRLVRSLPRRRGVIGVGTCDKGLPAMTMAVASFRDLAGAIVPGGVTLPPRHGEDAGAVQTLGARFAHGLVDLQTAADLGCRACASPGGGCQFLGTAATAQVVAEALGLTVPHAALAPSGQEVWLDVARRTAAVVHAQWRTRTLGDVLTDEAIENAMLVHAAFGGSTNLLIHIPAIAHAAGLRRPAVDDWRRVNASVPRLVDALPNGPANHPTVRVFLAGGVPEVMLHSARAALWTRGSSTAHWDENGRRRTAQGAVSRPRSRDGGRGRHLPTARAREGCRPRCASRGNIGGAVRIKSTGRPRGARRGRRLPADGVRVFTSESDAIAATGRLGELIRAATSSSWRGPLGTGWRRRTRSPRR
jgi:dihydroxyacid dehydratase/phosphogluconate dehydratase